MTKRPTKAEAKRTAPMTPHQRLAAAIEAQGTPSVGQTKRDRENAHRRAQRAVQKAAKAGEPHDKPAASAAPAPATPSGSGSATTRSVGATSVDEFKVWARVPSDGLSQEQQRLTDWAASLEAKAAELDKADAALCQRMLDLDKRENNLAQAAADLVRGAKTKAFGAAAIAEHEAERQAVIEAKQHLDKLRTGEGAYPQGTESLSEATGELMIVAAANGWTIRSGGSWDMRPVIVSTVDQLRDVIGTWAISDATRHAMSRQPKPVEPPPVAKPARQVGATFKRASNRK